VDNAIQEKDLQSLETLLGASKATAAARNLDGTTPLNAAASHGFVEIVYLLLEAGADPNQDEPDGWTPALDAP
jgi:ankyrin repeat protein